MRSGNQKKSRHPFSFFSVSNTFENAKISIPKFREKLIKNILISVWFILSWYLHVSKYHFLIQKSCEIFISIFDILSFVFKFKIGWILSYQKKKKKNELLNLKINVSLNVIFNIKVCYVSLKNLSKSYVKSDTRERMQNDI